MTSKSDSVGDELLRWASEAGAGSWGSIRDAAAHLGQKHALRLRPWIMVSQLSSLGHLDMDWDTREWSIAPPAVNLVPGLWLCVVLTGSRPYHVERRFEQATEGLDVFPFEQAQPPAPAAMYAQCDSVDVAEDIARRLSARFVVHPAKGLADAVRSVEATPRSAAPEPPLEEAERFDHRTIAWTREHGRQQGLYRVDLHGRPIHRWLDASGSWSEVDLPTGQFLALRESPDGVLAWVPATVDGLTPPLMGVRTGVFLPTLAERAATVSSGLLPTRDGAWVWYPNVPEDVAAAIAAALGQNLIR